MAPAVLGGGLMGQGIALVLARAGHEVAVYEPVAASRDSFAGRLQQVFAAARVDPALQAGLAGRIRVLGDLASAVAGVDLVIEAAPEKIALKQHLLAEACRLTGAQTIVASNTSVIPITTLAADLREQDRPRLLGTHWWNPPYLVPLVEVIQTEWSDPAMIARMMDLLTRLGKTPVHVRRDVAGFVGNRLQHALWREAISIVEAGICDAQTVDTVVKASFGRRLAVLGPLENADLVGTGLTLDIHRTILPEIDSRPHESPLLADLVAAGQLGVASGQGFRDWSPEQTAALRARLASYLHRVGDLLAELPPEPLVSHPPAGA